MEIAISRLHHPVTTLGPGNRVGLWFQGCSIRCPGCISVDTWAAEKGRMDLGSVTMRLAGLAGADGLTISGGEPFDQPEGLARVLTFWRSVSSTSILVFTGHQSETVRPWLQANEGLIDALVTGPFRSDLGQTMALRGSDNQALHILTEVGEEFRPYDRRATAADRRLDVMFDDVGDAWFAGIPARGDILRLRRLLAADGHRATTSANLQELDR